jgi:hypothetical protein
MNRGTFERRISRLDDAMRGLRFNRQVLLMSFATEAEARRLLELLAKPKGPLKEILAPGEIAEISALFAKWDKRLRTRLHQQ